MNLKIKNLIKSYDEKIILNNISLEIKDIHSIAIIGPSGGGKTTLLKILSGLEMADSGLIEVNGRMINYEGKELLEYRKTVGMVFQSYNLFPHITAFKNIVLPLEKVHKMDKLKAENIANELLIKFDLYEHKNKFPIQLSGGQRQRIAIIRALAYNPQFLLFDEPTSALDPSLSKSVLDTIRELKNENRDLILVTHEMEFAKLACEYCIYISDGIIEEYGLSIDLFKNTKNPKLKEFLQGY